MPDAIGLIKRLYRRLIGAPPIIVPGPVGDMFRKEKKVMQMALSSPAADVAAEIHFQEEGSYADVPFDQMLYRSSRGLLLTSSMITKGIGAGQMMTAATELTDPEAEELLKNLKLLDTRTPFEDSLIRTISSELGSKWV